MLVLGLDFETTGLNTECDRITEVGAVLWDTTKAEPLALMSALMAGVDYPPLSTEIQSLTGITQAKLDVLGRQPAVVFDELLRLMARSTLVVAHNGTKFDRPLFEAELRRQARCVDDWREWPWLDTSVDVPYAERITTRKLTHLAAEHGFVNPFPHRAVFDVLTMLTILSRYDIDEVLTISREPSVDLLAHTEVPWRDNGVSTGLAKARGYRWDGGRKTWTKTVKQRHVEKELAHNEFRVTLLEK
jgi:DNA polymerase-3 subunit epsilon